jgi:hypothetical protein
MTDDAAAAVEDLGAYVIAGRGLSHLPELGFRNVFLSERRNLKEAAVLLTAWRRSRTGAIA